MALLETLMIDVGGSIAKALLKRWLSNNDLVLDAASSTVDVLQGRVSDRLAQQRARQQFETIGEKVGESLWPLFEMDGAALNEESRTAVALAVADTLNTATSELLARHDLEPVEIARELLKDHPARSYHFSDTESRLYEQIVSESCQYIVDIASQLPHFTERTLAEVLTRERHLVEIAERTVQEVMRLRAELNPQVEAARFEMDYRRTVIRKLDELELFGSGMSVTARKYSLSLAYVELSLEQLVLKPQVGVYRPGAFDLTESKPQVVQTITGLSTVLVESPYLLLRGDAGSGKTTLMQWIAVQAASQCFPQELASWNGTVPFFIRLRQHIHGEGESEPIWPAPEDFPGLVAPAIAGAMPPGWVHRQLQEGRAIVLIDGIDEVPASLRAGVYAWLDDLVAAYPLARFVVTSRPYAASKDDLPAQDRLKEAQVLPMNLSAIEIFILQWHRAVAANLQDAQEQQDLHEDATHLIAEIRATRALQQLATNPLLCAMLCALNRERHQQLPSNRVALYEACCELLIERRDRERRISLADYPAAALSYEQKSLLLSDLAYWLVRNGQTEVSIEIVDERLTRRLGGMVGAPRTLQGADARLLFIERSNILRQPVKDAIDFTHRTLQEFLAAKAVVDENDIPLLVQHAHDDQWREVVLLTVGLASRTVRENLVERLLKRAETRRRFRSRLYLLAAACTQTAREEMKTDIRLRIEQGLGEQVPLKSEEQVEAMITAGTLAIPYLAPRFEYSSSVAAACVRGLLQIGSEAALNTLQAYTTDDTPAVIEALILGLREVTDKLAYAKRYLSQVKNVVSRSPATLKLLPFLPALTSLRLYDLPQMSDLSVLEGLPVHTSLQLSNMPQMSDLSVLEGLPALTSLWLYDLPQVSDFSMLERLPALTSLQLSNMSQVSDLSMLERLPALTSLELSNMSQVSDLSVLERLPALTSLQLSNMSQVSDFSMLERLPALTSLGFSNMPQVSDLSVLERLPALTFLGLYSFSQVSDFSMLERLPALTSLELYHFSQVSDLSVLAGLPTLTSLQLSNMPQVSDLSVLKQLPALTFLGLYHFPQVSDFSMLEGLPALTSLVMSNMPHMRDFSFLKQLDDLKSISLGELAQECVFPQEVLKRVRIRRVS